MKISPKLREFLTAWLKWAESGAKPHKIFDRHLGLCWSAYKLENEGQLDGTEKTGLEDELKNIFRCAYPFGNFEIFNREKIDGTMHENSDRLAWVRKALGVKPPKAAKTKRKPATKAKAKK